MCEMIFTLPSKWAADYDEHVTGNQNNILIPSINPPPWWRPVYCPVGGAAGDVETISQCE